MEYTVPISTAPATLYRIGVDVGGTNTDAALIAHPVDGTSGVADLKVIASSKSETTADVTAGICNAIRNVLNQSKVSREEILSVNVGTTHFINAVTEGDASKLCRVAVLRLCGPFGREVTPFADWPPALRGLLEGPVGYLSGGLEVDGRPIAEVSEEEVIRYAKIIESAGVTAVVIAGIFSNIDVASPTQEEFAKKVLLEQIPGLDVVCSRDIGNAPFIERENAAILNASILKFGRKTIQSFEDAFRSLELNCALYLTQNDGTVMNTEATARLPIKTFSSGATNSLTGAIFLSGIHSGSSVVDPKTNQIIMVDIGGTTSDFAALAPSGFPRQSPATVKVGGVRTAFSTPELVSIGLGGGSHVVQHDDGRVTVGPTSVGYQLPKLSKCFGGSVLTATDVVVVRGASPEIIGNTPVEVPLEVIQKASQNIRRQLERNIDNMMVSDQEVVLLLVGGGSVIQMDEIRNVKTCIRPPFYDVANAVGAAIAKVSGEIDRIEILRGRKQEDVVEEMKLEAIEAACLNGANRDTVAIVDMDFIPLQDAGNEAFRVVVRACGELSWEKMASQTFIKELRTAVDGHQTEQMSAQISRAEVNLETSNTDVASYKPAVSKCTGEWFLSEIDLAFIAEGCGIVGTGGGGSTYSIYLHTLEVLKNLPKGSMRVIDPNVIGDESRVGIVASVGAPSVSNERLPGENEYKFACETLLRYLQLESFVGLASGEIGGANGMCPIPVAALMGIPIIDGDCVGRAYPKVDMGLPYVYGVENPFPAVLADPRGNSQVVAEVDSSIRLERLIRSACIELGLSGAFAVSIAGDAFKNYSCQRTISQSWYIGRALALARQKNTDVVQAISAVIPGCQALFKGRVINVSRAVKGGWTMGTAVLESVNEGDHDEWCEVGVDRLVLQYQNEYFYAGLQKSDGSRETLCTTPDLISVVDMSGVAIATHEVRYGLMVTVIAMPGHPLWTSPKGLNASNPAAFGMDVEYKPLGQKWESPLSVIEEFGI